MKGGPSQGAFGDPPPQLTLVRELLKAPMCLVAITPGYIPPLRVSFGCPGPFSTLEEVMAAFRRKRPEGRWLVWIRGVDGEMVGVDSQTWEKEVKVDQEGAGRHQHHQDSKDCL